MPNSAEITPSLAHCLINKRKKGTSHEVLGNLAHCEFAVAKTLTATASDTPVEAYSFELS